MRDPVLLWILVVLLGVVTATLVVSVVINLLSRYRKRPVYLHNNMYCRSCSVHHRKRDMKFFCGEVPIYTDEVQQVFCRGCGQTHVDWHGCCVDVCCTNSSTEGHGYCGIKAGEAKEAPYEKHYRKQHPTY